METMAGEEARQQGTGNEERPEYVSHTTTTTSTGPVSIKLIWPNIPDFTLITGYTYNTWEYKV